MESGMGIESREYLRDDDNGYGQQPAAAPMSIVTKIIIATGAVFVLQVLSAGRNGDVSFFDKWFVLQSDGLFSGHFWKLLSYAFLHDTGNLLHIVMNMLILFMMGRAVVPVTGEREFLWFYCAAAIFAGICSVCFYRFMGIDPNIVGASGAVLATFTLFALHYPRQKLYIFGIVPVEARWLLVAYVLYDAVPVMQSVYNGQMGASRVAHSAHLGGLLFGWLYFRWNMRFSTWWDQFARRTSSTVKAKKTGLRVYNPKVQPESDLSGRVDEILAKISEHGESCLTDRERRILRQASEQMKKKR